jgi:hypothetical protein
MRAEVVVVVWIPYEHVRNPMYPLSLVGVHLSKDGKFDTYPAMEGNKEADGSRGQSPPPFADDSGDERSPAQRGQGDAMEPYKLRTRVTLSVNRWGEDANVIQADNQLSGARGVRPKKQSDAEHSDVYPSPKSAPAHRVQYNDQKDRYEIAVEADAQIPVLGSKMAMISPGINFSLLLNLYRSSGRTGWEVRESGPKQCCCLLCACCCNLLCCLPVCQAEQPAVNPEYSADGRFRFKEFPSYAVSMTISDGGRAVTRTLAQYHHDQRWSPAYHLGGLSLGAPAVVNIPSVQFSLGDLSREPPVMTMSMV